MNNKYCLITNDVEMTSILNHRLSFKTSEYVLKQGMPRLLELYAKHNIRTTFFFTADIAELYPEIVKMILPFGHEVGSHGLTHEYSNAFDLLSLEQQIENLKQSKAILEDISGQEIVSFRAPAARVNYNTVVALEEAGYKIDSSIASQRLDMFFSFGSFKKTNWITAPRNPYFTHKDNIFKRGDSSILEIPISALGFPYIGTFMRISPHLNKMTRNLLHIETKFNFKPIVFLTHPNEFINEEFEGTKISRRGSNIISYVLKDVLRHWLKLKNLGEIAIPILEEELNFFKKKEYNFVTMKEYYDKFHV